MAYPSLRQGEGTKLVPRSGIRNRFATNGTVRPRALSSAIRYDPVLVHPGLTLAEVQSLEAFHESNRGAPFSVTYQPENVTLTCVFAEGKPFDVSPMIGGAGAHLFNVTAYLVQST